MQPLYDSIGSSYSATRRADPSIAREIARLVQLRPEAKFLDVACGTGNYTCALGSIGGIWHGTDISAVMLKKAAERSASISWVLSSVNALPYGDGSFDGAVCSLAIHHFPDLSSSFQEVWRVLGRGRFVIFTSFPEQMRGYWLCHYFPRMMQRYIEKRPARDAVTRSLRAAGFEIKEVNPFHVTSELQDLFFYSGKDRPELYFDTVFRANMSPFAALCSPDELRAGLVSLRDDLDSGKFQGVASGYSSENGDYAYVVAEKPQD
jgi:ubiquinone/menaquinone biosynthesis C-methylase UbiE